MQIKITEDTAWAFEDMAPGEIFFPVNRKGRYCIGEVRPVAGKDTALGLLIFELAEGFEQSEIRLKWLYVVEGFRGQGIGNSLLASFYNIVNNLDKSILSDVSCDVPNRDEYNNLCFFLEKNDFAFGLKEDNVVEISMRQVQQCSFAQKEISDKRVTSINNISHGQWKRLCDEIAKTEAGFDRSIDAYEKKISSVIVVNDIPVAVMLLQMNGTRQLQVPVMGSTGKNKAADMAVLINYSIQAAQRLYGDDIFFKLVCDNPYTNSFVEKFFPDVEHGLVKSGHYSR